MNALSPWALTAMGQFKHSSERYAKLSETLDFRIFSTDDSIWVSVSAGDEAPVFFRACFVPEKITEKLEVKKQDDQILIKINASVGIFEVIISFSKDRFTIFKYTCSFTPQSNLYFPFWPRDILTTDNPKAPIKSLGEIHLSQVGTRSGILYFSLPERNLRILYFQNLTALCPFADQTGTSLREVVGGMLPEIGLSLPKADQKPLQAGTKVIISDAIIALKTDNIKQSDQTIDYLDMLGDVYLQMPKPETQYQHWPEILNDGLKDLIENPGCWSMVGGNRYLNAYVSDYETPPEIMVQLAVLLPLQDYVEWSGKKLDVIETIKKGLPAFYDEKLKTLIRWHPAKEDKLEGDEEQKMPMVMDSWYLHHPLLNLSRLALKGDKEAEKLFMDSLDFAIKVAHTFNYDWPVFYKMDTLEVIKAETKDGEGGEQDVPGIYAHVMLQAYELTGNDKYFKEAEKAAKKLDKAGDKIMYQANNTAFAAGAMLRLYKQTGKERYLNLSYRCLASIFQNVQLWDCNYGYTKPVPTFFALFPLSDAPYTAAYEEQEVFSAFHEYLIQAADIDILPSVKLLCSEFIRYLVYRAAYYYPPMLPDDMISDEVKTGEIDRNLWIVLEDIHDGIEKSGTVGQEVYGAGNAFGILPRHVIRMEEESFLIFTDCLIAQVRKSKDSIIIHLKGDERISYRLRIMPLPGEKMPSKLKFKLESEGDKLNAAKDRDQDLETFVKGNETVKINWSR